MKKFILRMAGCLDSYNQALEDAKRLKYKYDELNEQYNTVCKYCNQLKKQHEADEESFKDLEHKFEELAEKSKELRAMAEECSSLAHLLEEERQKNIALQQSLKKKRAPRKKTLKNTPEVKPAEANGEEGKD